MKLADTLRDLAEGATEGPLVEQGRKLLALNRALRNAIPTILNALDQHDALTARVAELTEALTPFARLAGPINGETGRPTYIDSISGPNGTDELMLSTHVGDGTRIEVLDAEDFRRAKALLTPPEGEGEEG